MFILLFTYIAKSIVKDAVSTTLQEAINSYYIDIIDQMLAAGFMTNLFNIVSILGAAMVTLYFLMDLLDLSIRSDLTPDIVIRNFCRLLVGLVLITNVGELFKQGNVFIGELIKSLPSNPLDFAMEKTSDVMEAKMNLMGVANATQERKAAGTFLFTFFIERSMILTMTIAGFQRAISLGVYYVFSPILMADVVSGGIYNATKKYRLFFARYAEVFFVYILTSAITELWAEGTFKGPIFAFIFVMTASGMIIQSKHELSTLFS